MSFKMRELLSGVQTIIRAKHDPKFPVDVVCGDESKVQTHFQHQCDINNIAKSIEATGSSDMVRQSMEKYGDFSDVLDVAQNLGKAAAATQLFEQMPAEVRKKAGHTVQGFFDMIQDPDNKAYCQKWGIFEPDKQEYIPPGSKKDGSPKKLKVESSSTEKEE